MSREEFIEICFDSVSEEERDIIKEILNIKRNNNSSSEEIFKMIIENIINKEKTK
ncbi:MAG: hypothetical protein ABC585_05505 [Candidatus Methanosuratincola petrocarbonis]